MLPVDGPFGDFSDDEGFRAQARRVATLGMVGKWAIHPKQVALANEIFTPTEEAVQEAREILKAMEEAKARGEGATTYKGRLVDIASIKQAENIVKQAEMIEQDVSARPPPAVPPDASGGDIWGQKKHAGRARASSGLQISRG